MGHIFFVIGNSRVDRWLTRKPHSSCPLLDLSFLNVNDVYFSPYFVYQVKVINFQLKCVINELVFRVTNNNTISFHRAARGPTAGRGRRTGSLLAAEPEP